MSCPICTQMGPGWCPEHSPMTARQTAADRNASLQAQMSCTGQVRGYDGVRVPGPPGKPDVTYLATPPARPVRVGDKVTWCGVVGVVTHVDQQGTAIEFPPRSGMYSSHYGWGWDGTHADGAPIDVEATLAELRGDRWRALESRPGFAVEITDQNRALQDRERLVVAEKRIVDLEAALKETERFARQENGRVGVLSDDLGALRTERDELAVENSRLRRTIERLERRGGKR